MIDFRALTNTPIATGVSPFLTGGSAVFVNFTAGNLIVEGSATVGGTYVALGTVPLSGMLEINDLTPFIRVSTVATLSMLA